MENRRKWFEERKGQIVFPSEKGECNCAVCTSIYEKGIKVDDYTIQSLLDYECESDTLRHFDNKADAISYNVSLTNLNKKAVEIKHSNKKWFICFKSVAAKIKYRKFKQINI